MDDITDVLIKTVLQSTT